MCLGGTALRPADCVVPESKMAGLKPRAATGGESGEKRVVCNDERRAIGSLVCQRGAGLNSIGQRRGGCTYRMELIMLYRQHRAARGFVARWSCVIRRTVGE